MKKRILSLLLTLCLDCSLLPGVALAEDNTYTIPESNITLVYTANADDEITITGYQGMASGALKIPATIDGKPVVAIGERAFIGNQGITSVTIPESVTQIGQWAFGVCTGLTSAHVPSTAAFNHTAFWGADNLTEFYSDDVLLPTLGSPTNLTWVKHPVDEKYPEGAVPGMMFWTNPELGQARRIIRLYREDGTEAWNATVSGSLICADFFQVHDFDNGTYYYTIQSLGDGKNYWNGPVATSERWTYSKPDTQLQTPTASSLLWKWPYAIWSGEDSSDMWKYAIRFYYAATADAVPELQDLVDFHYANSTFTDKIMNFNGKGYYYFSVRAVSKDLTKVQSSEWSELSAPYYYDGTFVEESISNTLDIVRENSTKENVRENVQLLVSTEDLETALKADQGEENGTAELLKKLEEVTGINVAVESAEDFSKIDTSSVEIVGAALNRVLEDIETITLNIGEPAKENVVPAQYNNTVAVQFSMELDGVVDQENLEIPVKITLPIPATINPSFLAVLHYTQSGAVEEIEPQTFQKDGKWFASFVLTSFSDFAMTETKQNSGNTGIIISSSNTNKKPTANAVVYSDVPANAWYNDAVSFVTEKALMSGTGNNTFAPGDNLTRAMLAQILYNNEGKPATSGNSFTDVQSGAWYADAVAWAAQKGIVSGYGNGKFGPNDNITREQFVAILWRYAGQPTSTASLDGFTDIDKASDYALTALRWAVEKGIISGKGNGTRDPTGNATRAEVAQMLMNYFK